MVENNSFAHMQLSILQLEYDISHMTKCPPQFLFVNGREPENQASLSLQE